MTATLETTRTKPGPTVITAAVLLVLLAIVSSAGMIYFGFFYSEPSAGVVFAAIGVAQHATGLATLPGPASRVAHTLARRRRLRVELLVLECLQGLRRERDLERPLPRRQPGAARAAAGAGDPTPDHTVGALTEAQRPAAVLATRR